MNIGGTSLIDQNRVVCRFNMRGMCRFGSRCRNLHEIAGKLTERLGKNKQKATNTTDSTPEEALGACSLLHSKTASKPASGAAQSCSSKSVFGPCASSAEEAVHFVRKSLSAGKTCGICFDTIVEKANRDEQTFGILPGCNHCFCFTCIRRWRQSKEFELEVARACPECRVASDFVYQSRYWLDGKQEKVEFIERQKRRMGAQDCKYFRKGKGRCPFGNKCLYLHALPNGKVKDVGPPKPRKRSGGQELMHQILFWLNDDDNGGDDDSDDDIEDFELDLDDPYIAMQYYDHDDIRRYIAMDRIANGSDEDNSDYEFLW